MKNAQAAIEYLMTYSWAILILAVVIGAFFYMNVFNPNQDICSFQTSGFSCFSRKLTPNGLILLLQVSGKDVRVIGFNCTASDEWVASDFQIAGSNVTIYSGEYKPLNGDAGNPAPLQCWKADGTTLSAQDAGQYYKGNLYIHYVDLDTGNDHKLIGRIIGMVE